MLLAIYKCLGAVSEDTSLILVPMLVHTHAKIPVGMHCFVHIIVIELQDLNYFIVFLHERIPRIVKIQWFMNRGSLNTTLKPDLIHS